MGSLIYSLLRAVTHILKFVGFIYLFSRISEGLSFSSSVRFFSFSHRTPKVVVVEELLVPRSEVEN